MTRISLSLLSVLVQLSVCLASGGASNSLGPSARVALTRIPRGGGWFGRFRKGGGNGDDDNNNNPRRYPALTDSEIEEKLNIPVFAITDLNGNSVIARDKNDGQDIQYLFLSQKMAHQALQQLRHNDNFPRDQQFKLVPLRLGKMWFKVIHNDTATFTIKSSPTAKPDRKPTKIDFRLVPDVRNLISARLMTSGENPEQLKLAMEQAMMDTTNDKNGPEAVQAVLQKALNKSRNFTQPYNEIPLFMIPTMRAQKRSDTQPTPQQVAFHTDEPSSLKMPIFLGAKDLVQAFLQGNSPTTETKVSVTSLHQLVYMMQQESDFDFRSIVILPLVEEDPSNDKDHDDDNDNDGGGGDFGLERHPEEEHEDELEPQIEMEMYTDFGNPYDQGYYEQLLSM